MDDHQHLEAFVDACPTATLLMQRSGNCLYANSAAQKVLGSDEAWASNFNLIERVAEHHRDLIEQMLDELNQDSRVARSCSVHLPGPGGYSNDVELSVGRTIFSGAR